MTPIATYILLPRDQRRLLHRLTLAVGTQLLLRWTRSAQLSSEQVARKLRRYRIDGPAHVRVDTVHPAGIPAPVLHVSRLVRAIGRRIRPANCLVQSLAAFEVLEREHVPVELRIGVTLDGKQKVIAHAWLLWHGQVIVGDNIPLDDFVPLSFFSTASR